MGWGQRFYGFKCWAGGGIEKFIKERMNRICRSFRRASYLRGLSLHGASGIVKRKLIEHKIAVWRTVRDMRRKDKEIKDKKEIEAIIQKAPVLRIAMCDSGLPYVVPVCFGYDDGSIFIHSAPAGRKIDILRRNNSVGFEASVNYGLMKSERACKWSVKYRSVVGFGKAVILDDDRWKKRAMDIIMKHYSAADSPFEYSEKALSNLVIIRIDIEGMTGKESGFR